MASKTATERQAPARSSPLTVAGFTSGSIASTTRFSSRRNTAGSAMNTAQARPSSISSKLPWIGRRKNERSTTSATVSSIMPARKIAARPPKAFAARSSAFNSRSF